MSAVASRRIPNVVFGLTFFWAGVSTAFFWKTGFSFSFLLPWVLSLITGVWMAQSSSGIYKKHVLATLRYREKANLPVSARSAFLNSERGITSSLGPVPFHYQPLPSNKAYEFRDFLKHSPEELASENALANVLGKYLSPKGRKDYGPYVEIFDALARIHLHPDHVNLPAGITRHGERSLITHSLLVCALMLHRAGDFKYKTGGLSPIDATYKLDPNDPLIPIIGFCHDIGKIRTFIFDADGMAIGFKADHDFHSARILAMLPEFWDERINSEERRVLQASLAYDHHMSSIPVQKNDKTEYPTVTSDRLHALLGLLSECDRLASHIEMGAPYSFKAAPVVFVPVIQTVEEVREDLFGNFQLYLVGFAPINARNGTKSIAFKYKDTDLTNGKDILLFDEIEFVDSFCKYMNKPELNVREGKSSAITSTILTMLDEKGYLFRPNNEVGERPASTRLYSFDFFDREKEADKVAFHIKSGFLVDVSKWPQMAKFRELANCNSHPTIGKSRFGAQGVVHRASAAESIAASALTGAPAVEVGQSIEALVIHKAALANEKIISKIKLSFSSNKFEPTRIFDEGIAITGHEAYFKSIGVVIKEFDELPLRHISIGIIKIKRSKVNSDQHVILLDKSVYGKYLGVPAVQ